MVLGRLEGMASSLPDTGLFLYMYVRKEALLSFLPDRKHAILPLEPSPF